MKDFQHLLAILQKKSSFLWLHYKSLSLLVVGLFFFVSFSLLQTIVLHLSIGLTPKIVPFADIAHAEYPILQRQYLPSLTAQAAYVLDDTSKVALFSKNEHLRFSPASTTKIMTALVGLDYYRLTDKLTIMRDNVEPVVVGFPKGSQVTFEDILYSMFLPSANDAALTVGDNFPGGEKAFVAKMNEKAQALHLLSTHFADPVGLVDDEDYTTVRDLALLASFAITHPEIAKIVNTKTKSITDSLGNTYLLTNINKLLGEYGVNGLKTGYTEEAGQVLVTSAKISNHTFIIVVMKSDDRFADTEKLLQMIENNVSYLRLEPQG